MAPKAKTDEDLDKRPMLPKEQFPTRQRLNSVWKKPHVDPTGYFAYYCCDCGKLYREVRSFRKHRKKHPERRDLKPAQCVVPLMLEDTHVTTDSPIAMSYDGLVARQDALELRYTSELEPRQKECNRQKKAADDAIKEYKAETEAIIQEKSFKRPRIEAAQPAQAPPAAQATQAPTAAQATPTPASAQAVQPSPQTVGRVEERASSSAHTGSKSEGSGSDGESEEESESEDESEHTPPGAAAAVPPAAGASPSGSDLHARVTAAVAAAAAAARAKRAQT